MHPNSWQQNGHGPSPQGQNNIGISLDGIGACVPRFVVDNSALTQMVDTSDEWITSRTGIKERHILQGNESNLDMALLASQDAIASAGIDPQEIDLIIAACSTPDTIYPALCCQLQTALGIKQSAGFDMAMACSGFTFGLTTASQFLQSGMCKTALVVACDSHSRYMDWYDRNTCVLFGDGAGAAVLRATPGAPNRFLASDMNINGEKGMELTLFAQVENSPLVEEFEKKSRYVHMNGREVFRFTVGVVPQNILNTVAKAGLTMDELDHLVLHQANVRIMEAMSEKLNFPMEKMIVNIERYGNTSAASIPIALNEAVLTGRVKAGDKIALCGFGAGLAWGTTVIEWTAVDKRLPSERTTALVLNESQPVTVG